MYSDVVPSETAVRAWKEQIWANLRQKDRAAAEQVYADLLDTISHPVSLSIFAEFQKTRRLHWLLNLIIVWNRSTFFAYAALIICAIIFTWWCLIGIPAIWIVDRFVRNPIQTDINVQLAAWYFAYVEQVDTETDASGHG